MHRLGVCVTLNRKPDHGMRVGDCLHSNTALREDREDKTNDKT